MKKLRKSPKRRLARVKNPVPEVAEHLHPFPDMATLASVPGIRAVMERARTPYRRNPLSEDEALNLVCDARKNEPTFPISDLLKKYRHELDD